MKKHYIPAICIYVFILALVVWYRYQVLLAFGFVYTDGDQNIMWEGLKNYSEGKFYEPRFYGQAYNTFLEAFLAIPLYKNAVPPYIALPIVTTALSVMPFVIISLFTFFKRSYLAAFITMSLPLLLPGEYALITSMPRGFVTGLFVAGFTCISVFYEKSKWGFFFAGLISVLAYSVNSNATLLCAACLLYLFLNNIKNSAFYKCTLAGLSLGGIAHCATLYFYFKHPFYNLHKFSIEFSCENLINGLKNLGFFLDTNTPYFKHGFMVLVVFTIIAAYFLYQKNYAKAISVFVIPVMIIVTLGINKVHEGSSSVFFSYSRMYLSVPLLLGFCLALFEPTYQPPMFYLWVLIPHNYYKQQLKGLEGLVAKAVAPNQLEIVITSPVERVLKDCSYLVKVCNKNKVDLFVIANHFFFDAYNHGCAACLENFPKTLRPIYERRTWRMLHDDSTVYKTVMIIDMNRHINEEYDFVKKIPDSPDLYLIVNNKLKTMQLLDTLKIAYRPFK